MYNIYVNIRNFSIIAHIDHGKSTLSDRLLEITHTVRTLKNKQMLDAMELEREHGITIKSHPVRMEYEYKGERYILNLIDTPGHVDFSYEVSRSLAACEGAILLIDASQGVEAQTISNFYLAFNENLTIIPAINKIDLPNIDLKAIIEEVKELTDMDEKDILLISAKTGEGVQELLKSIIENIPAPSYKINAPLKALIFDSKFNPFHGVIPYIRVMEGSLKKGDKIYLLSTKRSFIVDEIGYFKPEMSPCQKLEAGEVGYIKAHIKDIGIVKVGDTISNEVEVEPLKGYKHIKPYVFSGFYPTEPEGYPSLKDSLEKLRLNDPAFVYEPETSDALGFGFRCGFLGLLHMQIIQERLEKEFNEELIATPPSVRYRLYLTNNEVLNVDAPSKFPEPNHIAKVEEPYARVELITPPEYIGAILKIFNDRRAKQERFDYLSGNRVHLEFEMPLSEMIFDLYDRIKSASQGYASFDYKISKYVEVDLVRVDILINDRVVDALSFLIERSRSYKRARKLVDALRKDVPRQLFEVRIQAAIGKKIIAASKIPPLRKDVTAKCYGGDITRKRKLLEKQKEGKKRMRKIGKVELPQEAFFSILKIGD